MLEIDKNDMNLLVTIQFSIVIYSKTNVKIWYPLYNLIDGKELALQNYLIVQTKKDQFWN